MNKKVSDNEILTKRSKYKVKLDSGLRKSTNVSFADISVVKARIFVWSASLEILATASNKHNTYH